MKTKEEIEGVLSECLLDLNNEDCGDGPSAIVLQGWIEALDWVLGTQSDYEQVVN